MVHESETANFLGFLLMFLQGPCIIAWEAVNFVTKLLPAGNRVPSALSRPAWLSRPRQWLVLVERRGRGR